MALATQRFIEQNGLTDELQLKDAHKSGDITAIDNAINNFNQVMQAASQKMYAQAGAQQPGGAGFGGQDPNAGAGFQGGQQTSGHNPQDDIQDADFEEVK